jgi:hypothetical protein
MIGTMPQTGGAATRERLPANFPMKGAASD